MHYQTRNLFPYSIARTTMQLITFMFSDKVLQDDGSFQIVEDPQEVRARVIDLQPSDIQRLEKDGITINAGKSISIVGKLLKVPDYIILPGSELMRAVNYTFKEGVSILIADSLPGVI